MFINSKRFQCTQSRSKKYTYHDKSVVIQTYIYIYIERERQKCQLEALHCILLLQHYIFCCKDSFCWRNYAKSYCTRKIAASQSRMVHSKTRRVCPIHTRSIGPIGPSSRTRLSPWIESLLKGRSDMPWKIQRATVQGKLLRPNHVRYIPSATGSVLSTQKILDPSVHYPVLDLHLESSLYSRERLICHEWFKEPLYQESGCVPITYGTFQDPRDLSYPHKEYWTHRSIIQYLELIHCPTEGLICHEWFRELL